MEGVDGEQEKRRKRKLWSVFKINKKLINNKNKVNAFLNLSPVFNPIAILISFSAHHCCYVAMLHILLDFDFVI